MGYHKARLVVRVTGEHLITHGMSKSSEHTIWRKIKNRCFCVTNDSYQNYGGRGITMCQRWADSFENFYHDMGPRPSKEHSIDRIDNNGNYSPENCRWATRKEQNSNSRRNNFVEFRGERLTITEWSNRLNIHPRTIKYRLDNGWSIEDTMTTTAIYNKKVRK